MTDNGRTIDIVVPAHNEAELIGTTLREFHQRVAAQDGHHIRFVVCEDGSTDGTVALLQELRRELPIELISSAERKGYSRAVLDGLAACTADYVGFLDSDGQCDPADFSALFRQLRDADIVVGWRTPRADHWSRRLMSAAFGLVYRVMFPVRLHDPSCPYLVLRRRRLDRVLQGTPGLLTQGFWWEFFARAQAANLRIIEIPIHHRRRAAGTTRVYHAAQIPRIAWQHLLALRALRQQLRGLHREAGGTSQRGATG